MGSSADKASKVKSLLASYYDTDDAAEPVSLHDMPRASPAASPVSRTLAPQLASASSAGNLDVGALNASYFDPDAYLKRMLKETRLAELAAKQSDMAAEVGGLDSDMQMLVYENYNKFITATDTIKLMSASMEGMDSRMAQLSALLDGVVASSNAVNGKLERRQEEIEELNSVRVLLHKLQGVFDLPRKLRAAIERQAFEVAADAYADAAPLLKKYGHKGALRRVAGDVEACAREIAGILRHRLLAAPDQAAECIQMIAKLGEPTESLQEDFLECKRQRLEGLLAAAGLMLKTLAVDKGLLSPAELGSADEAVRQRMHSMFPPPAPTAPPEDPRHSAPATPAAPTAPANGGALPTLHAVVVQLDSKFITETMHTAALFTELFPPGGRKRLVKMCRECFARYLKLTRRALSDAAAIAAATAAGITSAGSLMQPLSSLLARLEQAVPARDGRSAAGSVETDLDIAADWGAARLLEDLYVLKTDLVRLDSLLPELSPRDRSGELVEHTVRQHVSLCFAALERRLISTVEALHAALADPAANGVAKERLLVQGTASLQAVLVQGLDRLLRSLKEYERQSWVLAGWSEVFVNSVHGQVSNIFLSVCQQFLAAAQVAAPASLSAAMVSSVRSTVQSAAPFAAAQRRSAAPPSAGGAGDGTAATEAGGSSVSGSPGPAPPPGLLLLLSKLCSFAEQEAVGSALVLLQQLYPERLLSGGEELPAFLPAEMGRQLAAAAGALLHGFVQAHGALLVAQVDRSLPSIDWASHTEPRAPGPVCDVIRLTVAEVITEASYLVGGVAGGAHSRAHSRAASASSAASWDSSAISHSHSSSRAIGLDVYMEASVSRMLSSGRDRGGYGGGLDATLPSIAAALLSTALRALVGAIRARELGRGAFQQVQLDVHYLRPSLQRMVTGSADGPAVLQLLDELMAVAMERCREPLLLEGAVLDRILAGSRQQGSAAQQQVSLL